MTTARVAIEIHGAVQGVGFRPFVYRIATEMGLPGWVLNDARGVFIEVDGPRDALETFVTRIENELPAVAHIDTLDVAWLDPSGFEEFVIRHSDGGGARTAVILPDLATCADCVREVLDPADRRHGYPFTNCTNCGPRFSIIQSLPYDRPHTTMDRFTMCPACATEYGDPTDRRFHAQPNACPECGPRVGASPPHEDIAHAAELLRSGAIVALKGIGGYQLLVDARDGDAVQRLRAAKARPRKPFAVMVPSLDAASDIVDVTDAAAALLTSPQAPIVLLTRRQGGGVADLVAPGNPTLGVMLPTTPLHHLLLGAVDAPLVATSGNLTDEPICIEDDDAQRRLGHIADAFVTHDRPIERHVDDSVAWILDGAPRLLRRARGYAPLPVTQAQPLPTLLATGAHLKNTIALSVDRNVFVSQHIGDLETAEAFGAFERVIGDLTRMYDATPVAIVHDLHPDYLSTQYATDTATYPAVPKIAVQHHHAHLVSCLADNDDPGPALGVTWDGTGYGEDGTVWGGEFLLGDASGFARVAHLRPFGLPGGDVAAREPRRCAASLWWELDGAIDASLPGLGSLSPHELRVLASMLERKLNTPTTTSAGRLFDAVAAMLDLGDRSSFEGEAAMDLEFAAVVASSEGYPMPVTGDDPLVVDWGPAVRAIAADLAAGAPVGAIASRFHAGLIDAIANVATSIGHPKVALSGGCFQNRILTEGTAQRLRRDGFDVLLHRRVPPNDGGISLGQITIAAARIRAEGPHTTTPRMHTVGTTPPERRN